MNKITRKLLVTLFLLALMPVMFAFESTLTLQGGVSMPTDDIEGEDELMGAWGLSWDAWVTKALAIGVNPYFTNLLVKPGDDNYSYSSSIEGVDVYFKFRPDRILALNFKDEDFINRIAPFVSLGAGYAAHGSMRLPETIEQTDNEYMFVLPHAAAGISFLTKLHTTLDLGVKYDYTSDDLIDVLEVEDWNDGYIMPYVGLGIHFGTRKPPEILVSGPFSGFSTVKGTPSAPQSYNVSGKGLKGSINITAPNGYELSIDGGRSWVTSATLDRRSDRPVLVRLTGVQAGSFQGHVVNASEGAADVRLPVNGVVSEPKQPAKINVSGDYHGFNTELGTPSAPQRYNISGSNLTDRIYIQAPNGFMVSVDGGKTWATSASLDPGYSGPVWMRLTGTQLGSFQGYVENASEGAVVVNLPVSGQVTEVSDLPAINITGKLDGFTTEQGTPSEPQSYTVNGVKLTDLIIVTPPNGYELSIDGGKTWVTSATLQPGFSGPVWVRLAGNRIGDFQGFVAHTSKGAENVMLPVSGTVNEHPEVTVLKEDLYTHVVHFPTNEYVIPEADKIFLDRVAESMKKLPYVRIQMQGHTDSTGGDKINIPLSLNRAKFVRDYLINKGIDISRIEVKGFSSEKPIASNATKEGRAANRRADMVVID